MLDVPKIRTMKYGFRQFSYEAATLWNAIFDGELKNQEHVDDLRKKLNTHPFKK